MSASTGEARETRERAIRALFVVAIFCSAFLIFLVQPMVGKRILPWFGGTPGVWTLCLAFYQSALFIGYAYAHLLIRHASPSLQIAIHALAVAAALLTLPVLPGDVWRPAAGSEPTEAILAMLVNKVALPFLVLASTGPLTQAWFARRYPERSPYPLFAVSNAGSMLALVCYPFALEPRLPLSFTGDLWTLAFATTTAMVLGCAVLAWRPSTGLLTAGPVDPSRGPAATQPMRVALWFSLSGCAVVLLMGVTNTLCLDTASVPFLWILPLVAYLGSLILSFGSERAYRRSVWVTVTAACLAWPLYGRWLVQHSGLSLPAVLWAIAVYCSLLFSACMVMHGELYRIRPPPRHLTLFYLCVTGGGALGGIFVGVVAPRIFDGYFELQIGVVLAWLLLLVTWRRDPGSWLRHGVRWRWGLVCSATAIVFSYLGVRASESDPNLVLRERTFFGVLRVVEGQEGLDRQRQIHSGSTLHGVQLIASPELRRRPTSYYGVATGIGIALSQREGDAPRSVGVVGLGAGTLATYAKPGDRFRFYEIDPEVIRISGRGGYFSFLSDSPADIELVAGDGRLSLERELEDGMGPRFDVLIIDAFSSDAIPVHLLTREAFAIYAAAIRDDGLIAMHITNRHFELAPLVGRLGSNAGLQSLYVKNAGSPMYASRPSEWIFLSRDPRRIESLLELANHWRFRPTTLRKLDPEELRDVALWTDDYSDLFGALRSPAWLP